VRMAAKKLDLRMLLAFILVSGLAGLLGSLFTFQSIPTWYASLNKPPFNPPNWVFGPVWTTLYLLMGSAAYLVYREGFGRNEVKAAIYAFACQLCLNAAWSVAFFGLRSIAGGMATIIMLWLAIALMLVLFYRVSRTAGLLIAPYLLWVSFASVLNFSLLLLNS